jgi:transposase
MSDITIVGLDLAKNVFQVHGADGAGQAVLRKKLRRTQVLAFFSANFRDAWLRWKRAAARISGAVRLVSWATKCA